MYQSKMPELRHIESFLLEIGHWHKNQSIGGVTRADTKSSQLRAPLLLGR